MLAPPAISPMMTKCILTEMSMAVAAEPSPAPTTVPRLKAQFAGLEVEVGPHLRDARHPRGHGEARHDEYDGDGIPGGNDTTTREGIVGGGHRLHHCTGPRHGGCPYAEGRRR